jgi:hypothetical protein
MKFNHETMKLTCRRHRYETGLLEEDRRQVWLHDIGWRGKNKDS